MASATLGTVVAVAKGTYDENVTLRGQITLWGACIAQTRIASTTAGPTDGSIDVTGSGNGVMVKNLQVGGSSMGIVVQRSPVGVQLDSVLVQGAVGAGLAVAGTRQSMATNLVVRDIDTRADGTQGVGIDVEAGGLLDATRVAVEGSRYIGALANGDGSHLSLTDTVVRDTRPNPSGTVGTGVRVESGAVVDLTHAVIEHNTNIGVGASDSGVMHMADAVVRDTLPNPTSMDSGRGIEVGSGAQLDAQRTWIEGNRDVGVEVSGTGAMVSLEDSVVRDTQPQESDQDTGRGISAQNGAALNLSRVVVADNHDFGVFATDPATVVTTSDLVVTRTLPRETDNLSGHGLQIQDGASATLSRASLTHNHEVGLAALGAGVHVDVTDLTISDTQSRSADAPASMLPGTLGRAIHAQDGAVVGVERAVLDGNHEVAVQAAHPGTVIDLSQVVISNTMPRACADTTCADYAGGVGLGAYLAGRISADHFVLSDSAMAGLQIARDGEADLSNGVVMQNQVGANVQVPGYDFGRLQQQVLYRDNGQNLDATELPLPDPGSGL